MSDALLRRTIRRCTALVLIVLGAIAVELASLEYPDGGNFVGGAAIVGGVLSLAVSALNEMADRAAPDGGTMGSGDDGGDGGSNDDSTGANDSSNDETGSDAAPGASVPPFGD